MLKGIRRLVAGAVIAAALSAFAASASQATIHTYCHSLVPANSRCSINYWQRLLLNTAEYNGAGTVALCQRVFRVDTSTVSHRCHSTNNYVESENDLTAYWPHTTLEAVCSNASAWAHTIKCQGHY